MQSGTEIVVWFETNTSGIHFQRTVYQNCLSSNQMIKEEFSTLKRFSLADPGCPWGPPPLPPKIYSKSCSFQGKNPNVSAIFGLRAPRSQNSAGPPSPKFWIRPCFYFIFPRPSGFLISVGDSQPQRKVWVVRILFIYPESNYYLTDQTILWAQEAQYKRTCVCLWQRTGRKCDVSILNNDKLKYRSRWILDSDPRRVQARIQDFGQGGPVEFWPQGGAWAQNLLKIEVFPERLPENCMIL